MGYAHYEIIRNGRTIEAGYAVEAVCEEAGCKAKIDRGLAYLCGKHPGGDERGCGGYFCEQHLYGDNQCKRCSDVADKANAWIHPETGEEFDLRDQLLPAGSSYDGRGIVWRHTGNWQREVPLVEPVYAHSQVPAPGAARMLTEGEWEDVARIIHRQLRTA
jgi:hypothetical protein